MPNSNQIHLGILARVMAIAITVHQIPPRLHTDIREWIALVAENADNPNNILITCGKALFTEILSQPCKGV